MLTHLQVLPLEKFQSSYAKDSDLQYYFLYDTCKLKKCKYNKVGYRNASVITVTHK